MSDHKHSNRALSIVLPILIVIIVVDLCWDFADKETYRTYCIAVLSLAFAWYLSYGVESIKHAVESERKINNIKRTAYHYVESVCNFSRTGDEWQDGEEKYVRSMVNHIAKNYDDPSIKNILDIISNGLRQMSLSKIEIIKYSDMIKDILTTSQPKS